MSAKKKANNAAYGGSPGMTCSPYLTPETDAEEFPVMTWPKRDNPMVVRSTLSRKLETERNELAGYICRIKLPLPVRFVADLSKVFPGKNVRMKDADGYLCIFLENADVLARGESATSITPKPQ